MGNQILIQVSGGAGEITGYVDACEDLDGVFTLTEEGTGERFKVHGWNVQIDYINGEEV